MAESSIPVDLFNPGQVFACLGFLEAADVLCGDSEGGFDWSDEAEVKFYLRAAGEQNPFETVLEFLAKAKAKAVAPEGWRPKKEPTEGKAKEKLGEELCRQKKSEVFPSASPDTSSAMPIQITNGKKQIVFGHWADGSSRNEFKLYAGNRAALDIATAMLSGTFDKPKKGQTIGTLETSGIAQIWADQKDNLIERPFSVTTPMGGSFNFDPRGGWTSIDAGYSPNDQKHKITASPAVELLAAWGLENARPDEYQTRKVRYSVWEESLPPMLARAVFCGGIDDVAAIPTRRFHFELNSSGKNKIVTFAEQEI